MGRRLFAKLLCAIDGSCKYLKGNIMKDVKCSYTLIEMARGVEGFIDKDFKTSELKGRYLDYALALQTNTDKIEIHYNPGQDASSLKISDENGDLKEWSPTQDFKLAKELIKSFNGDVSDIVDVMQSLRAIVENCVGDKIIIPMPNRH